MLKKKKLKLYQDILTKKFPQTEPKTLIDKSFFKNQGIHYTQRIAVGVTINNKSRIFFKTKQKLLCLFNLSTKVPNKNFSYSRFYLNHEMDQLKICNTFK